MKKKNNERAINEKMEKTFGMRRTEVVKDCPAIKDLLERWPSLFCENQIKEEFKRITTVHLERTFLSRLDKYTTKLLDLFQKKGGIAGTKIKPMLDSLNQHPVDVRRDIVIRCLVEYLGESGEELIKDYQDVSQEEVKGDCSNHMMKISVLHPIGAQETKDPCCLQLNNLCLCAITGCHRSTTASFHYIRPLLATVSSLELDDPRKI
uniref:Uncharacterized protein n=1 Tax=Knipowitschia caucasica TaxID=637954 RepID=A0AAV2LRL3_KNICA